MHNAYSLLLNNDVKLLLLDRIEEHVRYFLVLTKAFRLLGAYMYGGGGKIFHLRKQSVRQVLELSKDLSRLEEDFIALKTHAIRVGNMIGS